jgi:hypothetical protein
MLLEMEKREEKYQSCSVTPAGRPAFPERTGSFFTRWELAQPRKAREELPWIKKERGLGHDDLTSDL